MLTLSRGLREEIRNSPGGLSSLKRQLRELVSWLPLLHLLSPSESSATLWFLPTFTQERAAERERGCSLLTSAKQIKQATFQRGCVLT